MLNVCQCYRKRCHSMNSETLSLETIINEFNLLKKEVIIQWKTWKKRFVTTCKQVHRKILDPRNAKEHYQSFMRKEKTKSVKQSEITVCQTKAFENPNIVKIKSVIKNVQKILINYPGL